MNDLIPIPTSSFSALDLSINFAVAIILSCIVGWHYQKRARTKEIRNDLGFILPVICLTTLLVIAVVKSSLALSLGLVGALSIVRFRTPIKEPDELAYIFLSIAVGLCLGADQREAAFIGVTVILLTLSLIDFLRNTGQDPEPTILLTFETPMQKDSEQVILELTDMMNQECTSINIRRIETEAKILMISCIVKFKSFESVAKVNKEFLEKYPEGNFSFLDDSSLPNE